MCNTVIGAATLHISVTGVQLYVSFSRTERCSVRLSLLQALCVHSRLFANLAIWANSLDSVTYVCFFGQPFPTGSRGCGQRCSAHLLYDALFAVLKLSLFFALTCKAFCTARRDHPQIHATLMYASNGIWFGRIMKSLSGDSPTGALQTGHQQPQGRPRRHETVAGSGGWLINSGIARGV